MAAITIRRLDESVKERLRVRAAQHGRSMEEEARLILQHGLAAPSSGAELLKSIRAIVEPLGGIGLDLLPRETVGDPLDFGGRSAKKRSRK